MLKRMKGLFRVESIDLTRDHMAILLYLVTHKVDERVHSVSKLAEELGGISDTTVRRGYAALLDNKYVEVIPGAPPANAYEITDPNEFEVTPAGRKALRPILGTFGLFETVMVGALSFVLGVMAGIAYLTEQLYPAYFLTFTAILVVIVALCVVAFVHIIMVSREGRKQQLLVWLKKKET
jgi:hypothetical protein